MKKRFLLIVLVSVLVLGLLGAMGGYTYWHYQQPKFQDLTLELGQPLPDTAEFLTKYGKTEKAAWVTDRSSLELSEVGTYELSFAYGKKQETVVLTLVDTVAPVLTLQDLSVDIGTEVTVGDFVVAAEDLSEITLTLAQPLDQPQDYGDVTVEVIATDASGNTTRKSCTLSYVWMRAQLTVELGSRLSKGDILMNPEKDGDLLDQAYLDSLTAVAGEYTVTATTQEGQNAQCVITVADTVAPSLKVKDVKVFVGDPVSLESFLVEASDLSGEVTTRLLQTPGTATVGTQTLTVEAVDLNGNIATAQVKLEVVKDTTAPKFSGLGKITLDKGDVPNYTSKVTAKDDRDGAVQFDYDAGEVNLKKPGTYYVTYTAQDKAGNKATEKRKVEVLADTKAPSFSGLKDISTAKNKKPDYTAGVTAKDNWDGTVDFTYDDSKVDLTKAGTYYVTYTARDQAGNKQTGRRKVTVNHDSADTKALVKQIAAGLSSDPEAIRDYVRNSIKYSSDWGGDDPTWFGFKNKKGNCYVHALCLQDLLEEKGYTTKLIWVTDKSHYWLLIKLGDTWKHIDATPGTRHTKYSLMNDQQRLETLQGRKWDTSKWPAAE